MDGIKSSSFTKFKGLSGDFSLMKGWLGVESSSVLEVFNVIGQKERIIGYWSPQIGLFQDLEHDFGEEINKLKQPIWPGCTAQKPTKLRIGVLERKGFSELRGLAIELFSKVVKVLPFPVSCEFVPLKGKNEAIGSTYDDLLCKIIDRKLDAIVGDITILWNRTRCVDFTLPYSESNLSMMVSMVPSSRMWILLKPFNWTLWLLLASLISFLAFTIVKIECAEINRQRGNPRQKLFDILLHFFTFYTHEYLNKWSRWIARISKLLFFVTGQIYMAILVSILIGETALHASLESIQEIKENNYFVGYQRDSWVKGVLEQQLGFRESQLKGYDSVEEYERALSLGSEHGGVAAIFDETPYLRLFLSKYGSHYGIVGSSYKPYGFGLAFPRKSPLVPYFSVAILNVTQDIPLYEAILSKYSLSGTTTSQKASYSPSLRVTDFGGLLIVIVCIIGAVCGLCMLGSFISNMFGRRSSSQHNPDKDDEISYVDKADEISYADNNDPSAESYYSDYY